ncbi:hypothetical protein [Acinetobacter rudis]|uniref:Outer membrane protein beta-barrel domain-containing protein n=1 Tax=Acinetobacter rudis CIP 110305 TaxID=421052 RepID=S3NNK0_9GAMM|nr:hypothetical protein [Acinetobacter rudis]EPF79958.1 hypothetical protein F945_00849 [Acinetobacter rudis CIP 110305]
MKIILPFIFLGISITQSHAATQSEFFQAKLKTQEAASAWNAGAGLTMKLAHVNMEWVNPYGIAYIKAGAFLNNDHAFGGQVGFRYPLVLTGTEQNGYYLGAYMGHLKSTSYAQKTETQLGAGADFSYVFLNKERISTLSVGLGAGQKVTKGNVTVFESKPVIQFAYTFSLGL